MSEKKKLTDEQKMYLMYSGELLVFSLIFIVLGVLKIVGTINYNSTRRMVFNYLTLAGCLWGYIDFFWALLSKKRHSKSSMLDKSLTLVLSTFMIIFDILCLATTLITPDLYNLLLGVAILYGALIMAFEGIYHYFYPVPSLVEEINKLKEEEAKKEEEENNIQEENDVQ